MNVPHLLSTTLGPAADQQGVVETVVVLAGQRDQSPGVFAQAVGAVACGADLPGVLRQERRDGAGILPARPASMLAGDCQ
ncbi:hypothetical protein [Streptomyces decoyicus]|uniref:hypothetical protein n=1 Tax=Streptomyces decoyicus TaxID=249567 RepID=UPI00386E6893|nr:hypothetical protein OG532_40710 [Streptomyces decoyicus]